MALCRQGPDSCQLTAVFFTTSHISLAVFFTTLPAISSYRARRLIAFRKPAQVSPAGRPCRRGALDAQRGRAHGPGVLGRRAPPHCSASSVNLPVPHRDNKHPRFPRGLLPSLPFIRPQPGTGTHQQHVKNVDPLQPPEPAPERPCPVKLHRYIRANVRRRTSRMANIRQSGRSSRCPSCTHGSVFRWKG